MAILLREGRILCLGLTAVLAATRALAQSTVFNPALRFDEGYEDNVAYLSNEPAQSDWTSRAEVDLPVTRDWKTGLLSFSYRPAYERYRTFDILNHWEHRLNFSLESRPSRASTFEVALDYLKTQAQGQSDSQQAPDLYLAGRADRTVLDARFAGQGNIGQRWRLKGALNGSRETWALLAETPSAESPPPPNRNSYAASMGVLRVVSRSMSLGIDYRRDRFDLDTSGSENVDTVEAVFDVVFGRDDPLSARLGGYRRSSQPVPNETVRDSGVSLGVQFRHAFRRSSLAFEASRVASAGGSLQTTSTDTSAGVVLTADPGRSWAWDVSARWAQGEPTDTSLSTVTSKAAGFGIEWRPNRDLGIRLSGQVVDQSGRQDQNTNGSYSRVLAGIVWYPLGHERAESGERP